MDREKNKTGFDSVKTVLQKEAAEIQKLADHLNQDDVNQMLLLLNECNGKVITCGCGTSGAAAKKIAHTLNCINRPAFFLSPSDALHGGMGVIQEEDLIIFFSDPLTAQPHDPDVKALLRIAQVYDIPIANNKATADFIITSDFIDKEYNHDVINFKKNISERAETL